MDQLTPIDQFPSVEQTFKEAWERLKKGIFKIFIVHILGIIPTGIICVILFFVLIIAMTAAAIAFSQNPQNLANWLSANFIPVFILSFFFAVFSMLIFTFIGAWIQAGSVLSLTLENERKITLGEILKESFKNLFPLFSASLLVLIFIIGGYFVFAIPALVFFILFQFVPLAVVLEDKKGIEALKRSVAIVTHNFWIIFWRELLLWAIFVGVYFVLVFVSLSTGKSGVSGLVSLVQFVLSFGFGWYSLAYTMTLYSYTKKTVDDNKKTDLLWIVIIAVIGWVIAIFVGVGMFVGISSLMKSGVLQKMVEQSYYTKKTHSIQQPGVATQSAQPSQPNPTFFQFQKQFQQVQQSQSR